MVLSASHRNDDSGAMAREICLQCSVCLCTHERVTWGSHTWMVEASEAGESYFASSKNGEEMKGRVKGRGYFCVEKVI